MNRLLKQFMAAALAPFALITVDRGRHRRSAGKETATGLLFARLMFVQSRTAKRPTNGTH